jgi:glutamine synthetase
MYLKSPEEVAALGIKRLPQTLGDAVEAFAADPLSKAVFDEGMYGAWLDYKRDEWISYLNHVSDWERARYLKFF